MSKILSTIKAQRKLEGDTEDLKEVVKIHKTLLEATGHVWNSDWQVLIDTKFVGVYPNTKRHYYTSAVYKALKESL